MFDLAPTPHQPAAVAAVRGLREDIRERARAINNSGVVPAELMLAVTEVAEATGSATADGSSASLDPAGLVLVGQELAATEAGLALATTGHVLGDVMLRGLDADRDGRCALAEEVDLSQERPFAVRTPWSSADTRSSHTSHFGDKTSLTVETTRERNRYVRVI